MDSSSLKSLILNPTVIPVHITTCMTNAILSITIKPKTRITTVSTGPAAISDVLKDPLLTYPIPQGVQEEVWYQPWASSGIEEIAATYFEFYAKRIRRHLLTGEPFCLRNHSDVVHVAKKILGGTTRHDIRQNSLQWIPEANDVEEAIDLCASLLAMTEFQHSGQQDSPKTNGISGRTPITWDGGPLQAVLSNHFTPQKQLVPDNQKLGRVFTARNLNQIGGIEIRWTTNLEDHLRLVDDDEVVFIFRDASFLQMQQNLRNSILPRHVISETLETIALRFPSDDQPTQKWLSHQESQQRRKFLTPSELDIGKCGVVRTSQRRIDNFSIWHDRLIILKQAFDDSQPATLSQWWFDRRNRVQWYTFWVAILVFVMTMFFGLVQSVEGALQVCLAYQGQNKGG